MITVTGITALQKKLKSLTDSKSIAVYKTAFAKAAKPARKAARTEAPKEENNDTIARYKYGGGGGIVAAYEPGNLKKSIAIGKNRSRVFPAVWVGARAGAKNKYDGWYAHFVNEGHRAQNGKFIPGDNFMGRAFQKTEKQVSNNIAVEFDKVIQKKFG